MRCLNVCVSWLPVYGADPRRPRHPRHHHRPLRRLTSRACRSLAGAVAERPTLSSTPSMEPLWALGATLCKVTGVYAIVLFSFRSGPAQRTLLMFNPRYAAASIVARAPRATYL